MYFSTRPNITSASRAYPSHWQLRGVKCWRRLCDIADAECALHTHTHHQSRSHLEGGGNPICIRVLGGRRGKDEWGPFHLSWSVQRNPLALTAEVKIVKLENVQLPELQGIYLIHGVVRVARGGYLYWQACGKVRCLWLCLHSECRILSDGRRAGREKRQSRNTFPPLLFISLWREALLFSCCQISVFFFFFGEHKCTWVVLENRRSWEALRGWPTSADHSFPPFILVMRMTLHACV